MKRLRSTVFLRIGQRILISKRRQSVRGTIIFFLTHLIFFMGVIFTVEIALLMLGANDVYVPLTGRIIGLVR